DKRNVVSDRASNESVKRGGIRVLNDLCDDHSLTGDSADNSNLAGCSTCVEPLILMFVLFFSADKSFIDFDFTTKRNKVALHRGSPSHAHIPTCVIVRARIFTKDYAVNLQRANSFFSNKHQVSDLEPQFQRYLCVLKDSVSENREAITVTSTAIGILAYPMKRSRLQSVNSFSLLATGASNRAIRPAHFSQELLTGFFSRKLPVKSVYCFHATKVTQNNVGVNTHLTAFSKGEFSPVLVQPLFGKRGEGEILGRNVAAICNKFQIY